MKRRLKQKKKKDIKHTFVCCVKIRPDQLEFLKSTKRQYSIAGYLDMIINFWRDYEGLSFVDTKKEISKGKKKK